MALPNLMDIGKTVTKLTTKLGSIEKKVEGFAKDGAKGAATAATAAATKVVTTAMKPVKLAVGKVVKEVGALKQWVVGQIGEVWKTVKANTLQLKDLATRMAKLENYVNPLVPLGTQAALLTTHEPRIKKIEGAAGKSTERDQKLKGEIRELKDAIKLLKKEVEALQRQ